MFFLELVLDLKASNFIIKLNKNNLQNNKVLNPLKSITQVAG
jgi:hypothetical protein